MNKALLVGRLTREPELKTTGSGTSVCTFSLAVQRKYKNADGEYEADFINCVAWRSQAEFLAKFFNKGSMVGIVGSIQTRNYEKDGQRIYITDLLNLHLRPGAKDLQTKGSAYLFRMVIHRFEGRITNETVDRMSGLR